MKPCCLVLAVLVLANNSSALAADDVPRQILILDVESGEFQAVAPLVERQHQGSPVFSPDSTHVAFNARQFGGNFGDMRLHVKNLKKPDEPAAEYGSGGMPSYSANGEEIAYSDPHHGGVWIMDADGRGKVQIRQDAWHILFSPVDDDIVAYGVQEDSVHNIVLHDLTTDETRRIVPENVARQYKIIRWNFQWSWDASLIAFKGFRHNGETVLAVVETTENDPQHFVLGTHRDHPRTSFHPATRELFFTVRDRAVHRNQVFSVTPRIEGQLQQRQRHLASQPDGYSNEPGAWSVDGKRLLLISTASPGR